MLYAEIRLGKTYINCIPKQALAQWIRDNVVPLTKKITFGETTKDEELIETFKKRGLTVTLKHKK